MIRKSYSLSYSSIVPELKNPFSSHQSPTPNISFWTDKDPLTPLIKERASAFNKEDQLLFKRRFSD